ncbi:MAG: transporter substrate-binding domain-containing protein [Anaerolineae bacterium]|nr:transporter substrate-binding domain-containing protein [Anaerolineae bacterium]
MKKLYRMLLPVLLMWLLVGCGDGEEVAATAVPPTPTLAAEPTLAAVPPRDRDFIVVATDAPHPPYTIFDAFGVVDGFDSRVLENIAAHANLDYELIVTPYQGVLANIASSDNRDFDAVIANLSIPEELPPGIVYTDPYLEVGQVLVVLADNRAIQSYGDLQPGMLVGVAGGSQSEITAREVLGVAEQDLINHYVNGVQALQALIDEGVTAVVADSTIATFYADSFPEQLKIVGGDGNGDSRDAWITQKAYGLALAADNEALLTKLNAAITAAHDNGDIEREIAAWLVPNETLEPGESRVGTPADELFIGILGELTDMDPATQSDLVGWEVKNNTMSGLYRFTSDNELVPLLAASMPTISEDGLEYTVTLRRNLRFPDGRELTADDVKWAVDRANSLGNFNVNSVLKDSDGNFYADDDAVQVVDAVTVKFVLQEPTATFPALLATPPFFPISRDCYAGGSDPTSICGGIGPYTIIDWVPGERLRLRANPDWPGRPSPAFANITLRFYDDAASLRRSLAEFGSIDLVWRGLPYHDFTELQGIDANADGQPDFLPWSGPADFKSYLLFNQAAAPWDEAKVRQAAALSLDRERLAAEVFGGSRSSLLSPVPDAVPGYTAVLPPRDLNRARALLLESGYSETTPLEIELWYVSDGRYSLVEEAYATAVKTQLEETGVFQVTLNSAPFEQFRAQLGECSYPASLLGWPSPGRPVDYLDVMAWTEFFVTSNSFCLNYESEEMTEMVTAVLAETDATVRATLHTEYQQLWAEELPTLDILQQPTFAISLPTVNNVRIDALGLLHYEILTKR